MLGGTVPVIKKAPRCSYGGITCYNRSEAKFGAIAYNVPHVCDAAPSPTRARGHVAERRAAAPRSPSRPKGGDAHTRCYRQLRCIRGHQPFCSTRDAVQASAALTSHAQEDLPKGGQSVRTLLSFGEQWALTFGQTDDLNDRYRFGAQFHSRTLTAADGVTPFPSQRVEGPIRLLPTPSARSGCATWTVTSCLS